MKKVSQLCSALILIIASSVCLAQLPKPNKETRTVTEVMDGSLKNAEREFVGAADVMPEDKYSFAPTNGEFKGVRNFAQQIKHTAAVNYEVGAAIIGEKPPVEVGDESGPESVKTKAQIMQFLKDSFAYMHKAVAATNEQNMLEPIRSPFGEGKVTRLGMATLIVGHCYDHYGQMVEYLRMNGIIPPASRGM